MNRKNCNAPALIEQLDPRRLYTAVTITGTSAADTINLSSNGTTLTAVVNGTTSTFTKVTSIAVNGGGGGDHIELATNVTLGAVIAGNAGYDTIIGGSGNDTINGDAGDDYIDGEAGNDSLNGGDGNDTLLGKSGADRLYSGPGQNGEAMYANNENNDPDGSADSLFEAYNDTTLVGYYTPEGDTLTGYTPTA